MNITQAEPTFRPVTVELETQDELDQFLMIFETVARQKLQMLPQVVAVAKRLFDVLTDLEEN